MKNNQQLLHILITKMKNLYFALIERIKLKKNFKSIAFLKHDKQIQKKIV